MTTFHISELLKSALCNNIKLNVSRDSTVFIYWHVFKYTCFDVLTNILKHM